MTLEPVDPTPAPFTQALQAAATKVIGEQAEELTMYPGGLGHAGLRAAMARREGEREGVEIDPDHLIITNGSMQAVTLTAEALQENKGDTVLVEEFSCPGTLVRTAVLAWIWWASAWTRVACDRPHGRRTGAAVRGRTPA